MKLLRRIAWNTMRDKERKENIREGPGIHFKTNLNKTNEFFPTCN